MKKLLSEEILLFKSTNDTVIRANICEKILQCLSSKKIIIYGAGASGTTLSSALINHGIYPVFFIDRKYKAINTVNGIDVFSPEELKKINGLEDKYLIIIAINAEVIRNLNDETFSNIIKYTPNIDVVDIGADVTNILNFAKCTTKLNNNESFDLVDCFNCGAETRKCSIYAKYLEKISVKSSKRNYYVSRKFDWFGYIMGQYCTLKCKHCCEHIPYLKNREFTSSETIINDCRKITEACKFIRYIELIGGEPFLHPHLSTIVSELLKLENVGYIKIFTNATVLPSKEMIEVLKEPRVVLNISNYLGAVNKKREDNILKFREIMSDNNINYIISESKTWLDMGDFYNRNKAQNDLENDFKDCFIANCHRVYNGILYRCPHQYAGVLRGFIPLIEGEYINLNSTSLEELGHSLDDFEELKYTEACKQCDMPYNCPEVPAAIQIEEQIK